MQFRRIPSSVAAGILALGICLAGGTVPRASAAPAHSNPLAVVKGYFSTLDADLKSGSFTNLGSAYAPNATLKVIDVNGAAIEYHGLPAIIHYWKHRGSQVPGLHFTADRIVSLDTLHVAAFERTSNNKHKMLAGRCAHLFKVKDGKIVFDAYFGVAFTKSELAQL